ncbi:MAG: PhoU domain-containing protein [Candidatus Woesearchaeota archaeon]
MEYRKLIGFGKGSYVLSLPKSWVKQCNIKQGDILQLEKRGEELVIRTGQKNVAEKEPRWSIIDITGLTSETIETRIVSAYLSNSDYITVKGTQLTKQIRFIKSIFKSLPGMEIFEEDSGKIVFKDLIDLNEVSVKVLIRRIDNIVRGMLEECFACETKDCYESIYQRDFEVNRLCFLSHRIIRSKLAGMNTQAPENEIELLLEWGITTKLEKIGDRTKRIARILSSMKKEKNILHELNEIQTQLQAAYLELMKAYHNKDIKAAEAIELSSKKRALNCDRLLSIRSTAMLAQLVENLKGINISIRDIARDIVNLSE